MTSLQHSSAAQHSPAESRRAAHQSAFGRMVVNALALSLSRPLTWLSATGLTILLPSYLGDVNLGKINAAFAFADWCGLLVSLGIGTYLTKEVARRASSVGSLILNAAALRLALAAIVAAFAFLIAGHVTNDNVTRDLIYLLSLHMVLVVFSAVLVGGLQGLQQLRVVALFDALSKLALLGLVVVFALDGLRPVEVAFAYLLSDLVGIAGYLTALMRGGHLRGPIELGSWLTLLKGGVPFFIWEASLLTYARIDVVILSMFATSAVLGWYYAAYRIISIPLFLPTILMTVTFPALSASVQHPEMFRSIARNAVRAALIASVPMSFGLIVLPGKIMEAFSYPESFSNAALPTAILAAGLPLVAVNMIVAPALAALDRQRQWAIAGVGAAILNPLLNFAAIPLTQNYFDNGAIGAATVTTFTEVYLLAMAFRLLPKGVLDRSSWTSTLRCLLAGLTMAGVLFVGLDFSAFVLVPLGAVVYGAACLAFRVVTLPELKQLATYVRSPRRRAAPGAIEANATP